MKFRRVAPIFTLLIVLSVLNAPASETGGTADPQRFEMNGLSLKDYADFDRLWKLVTVRYREDSKEIRFVYANQVAWEALQKKPVKFPEGSMFAKIAAVGTDDPLFTSSKVPEGSIRYQLMKRDFKSFPDSDGWGYALFNSKGNIFEGDIKSQTVACHACHRIASSRDFVFSTPMMISPFVIREKQEVESALKFRRMEIGILPEALVAEMPPRFKSFYSVEGPLKEHIFQGTLDEVRPSLIEEAQMKRLPTVLFEKNGKRFSAAIPELGDSSCGQKSIRIHLLSSAALLDRGDDGEEDGALAAALKARGIKRRPRPGRMREDRICVPLKS